MMPDAHRTALDDVRRDVNARRWSDAATKADDLLRAAAGTSRETLLEVAKPLTDVQPLFHNVREAERADAFFARVASTLSELLEPEHELVSAANERLAMMYAIQGRVADAARIGEQLLERLSRTLPPDDARVALARDNLAIQYHRLGQPNRAAAMYADVHVCEHLEAVRQYLLERGAAVTSAGQAWSKNCRMWIYFDVILDPDALRTRFALPACVTTHVHRGTHDGSEQGLVCEAHHDALMGMHPDASHSARVIG